jgi:putative oxidoreductase
LQRLFSAFPNSWPGGGLLLQRVVTAVLLFWSGLAWIVETPPSALTCPHVIGASAGILLLLGLWTPVCGIVIAVVEMWIFLSGLGGGFSIMLATSGIALAMIGPGAWSLDAHLFGRKHFEIPER